jgi:hypothetical protein
MSDEQHFIKIGRPVEGAFRSMLAAGFQGADQLTRDELQLLRKVFFAGARAAMQNGKDADASVARWAAINAELEAFGRRLIAELPTHGRG